jgi:hypothetical protein
MAATYTPIASITLGATATSVTFSSIPQTYTDLVMVEQGTSNAGTNNLTFQVNGDTGTNYSRTTLFGTGSVAGSSRSSNSTLGYANAVATTISDNQIHIFNYSNTTTYKTFLTKGGYSADQVVVRVNLWRSTAAITSLFLACDGGNSFASGTTFNLYGILGANA